MAKAKSRKKPESVGNLKADVRPKSVPNPMYSPAHDGQRTNPRTITVNQNAKESAITLLRSRDLIDDCQELAADRFRALWEAIGGKGASSIDYLKEPVDGGGVRSAIQDRQIDAGRELKRVESILGAYGYRLMVYVCGQGYSLHELTATRRQRDTMTDMLRLHLDELAAEWGYRNRAQRSGNIPLHMCRS